MCLSGIAGSYGNYFRFFWENSIVAIPIYIPTSSVKGFPFLHTFFSICYL